LPGYFLTVATRALAASEREAYTLDPGPLLLLLPVLLPVEAAADAPLATTEGSDPPRLV